MASSDTELPNIPASRLGPTRLMPDNGYVTSVGDVSGDCDNNRGVGSRLDCSHDWMYVRTQKLVERIDHWFAKEDAELMPVPLAPMRIGIASEYIDRADGGDLKAEFDVDVSLRLPNLEKRLRIFFTSMDLDESPNEPLDDETDVRAGLRFELPGSFDFDIGARANVPPEAFAALKWGIARRHKDWYFYPFAKIYVESDEGIGFTTAFTMDKWWGRIVARSSSYLNWDDAADAIEWDQTFAIGYARELLDDRRYATLARGQDMAHGCGINVSVLGENMRGVQSYRAGIFYKRPLRGRWLYWSIGPEVRWDREYDWNPDPGVRLHIDTLFWGLVNR